MKRLWRVIRGLLVMALLAVLGLLSPVAYVETMCRPAGAPQPYATLLDPAHHRPEARTLMTYPEWHIVHAYEDYAKVIETGDPHQYRFLRGIGGFWSSLCALSRDAGQMGPVDGETRQMVHVIGVSFTAELLLKAAYEETLGRLFAALRGPQRAPLDDVSAAQSAAYAAFLQQVPWYKWPFERDAADLDARATGALRDRERQAALGLEYRAKAAYAGVIASAVAQAGPDALTLRMIVAGAPDLAGIDGITVIAARPEGTEIETPRYRALTALLARMAADGLDFVEIAGNDDILLTVLSDRAVEPDALASMARQGFGDYRHLVVVKVPRLAETLRALAGRGLRLEHIHDY